MATPDVVVVGGGCVGLASAIALAGRGANVTIVERGLAGGANSSHHGSGIRQQFGTALNIRLSQLSADTWDEFEARFGVELPFHRIGYLFLARSDHEARTLQAHVELQHDLGVDSEFLMGDELVRRWPILVGRGFVGGGFRAGDGWANQFRIVDGFVRGALAAGVDLHVGTEALALTRAGGRVVGVRTTAGPIAVDAVLLATGPWLASLLDPMGIFLPVEGRRHELLLVQPESPPPEGMPWLIAVEDAVHVRSADGGRVQVGGFLGEDRAVDPDRFEQAADVSWATAVLERVDSVLGVVGPNARIVRGWAGLYPTTPDRHPIIDRLADGLFVSTGFAGTGVMHAPAAGLLVAELLLDGAIHSVEAADVQVSRFGAAAASRETTGF